MDLRTQLADNITALIEPYEHCETLHLRSPTPGGTTTEIRIHRVQFPSLLEQLSTAVEPSRGNGTARGYESSPSANLEAVACLATIDKAALRWCRELHATTRQGTAGNLRALVGAAMTDDQLDDLTRASRRWHTWASVITNWEKPPRRQREPCPACNHKGGLRVRVEELDACCIECGATWDRYTIGILGDYIRAYNNEPAEENAAA